MANTSSRTLRLLTLLQTHRFWPGVELADRLEVSERTLRRDIDRLRDLGYPVRSSRGLDGGYQLAPGGSMPPLVVEEDEAIAMVVALGDAANVLGGTLSDAALSALSKVTQVLPARLRRRAEALRAVTDDSSFFTGPPVEASVLGALASAIRDSERVRFSYTARGGAAAGEETRRHVEPHRLVTVGRRWYLVAFDLERADWRSFRLDRMGEPMGTRSRFRPREIPGGDAGELVRRGLRPRDQPYAVVARVAAPAETVAARIGRWADVEPVDDATCRVRSESGEPDWIVVALYLSGAEFTVESATDGVREELESAAGRLRSALASGLGSRG